MYAALFSPTWAATSHRTIGFPIAGRDDYLDTVRSLNAAVPNARLWQRSVEVRGDAGLVLTEVTGTTLDGSDDVWTAITVLHHTAGVIDVLEVYEPEDAPAARARFAAIAAQPADPSIPDNAVVRRLVCVHWLGEFESGPERSRFLRAMWTDDIEYRDLRKGVSGEPIIGRDEVNQSILETRKVFGRIVDSDRGTR